MSKKKEPFSDDVLKFSRRMDLLFEDMRQAEIAGKIEVLDIVSVVSCAMGNVMAANVHPEDWEHVVVDSFEAACICLDQIEKESRNQKIKPQ
jgi:hypothetical protein